MNNDSPELMRAIYTIIFIVNLVFGTILACGGSDDVGPRVTLVPTLAREVEIETKPDAISEVVPVMAGQ